jgi:16S rRNA (cytosine1402-N4)-methyltransferase
MHIPVLLNEALEFLHIRPGGRYLDATAGLGGHTGAIARRLADGFVIACDRDEESLNQARENTREWAEKIRYARSRYSELASVLASLQVPKVDGLLADLGVSRYQLTDPERGFSISADGPLDMRMDRSQGKTASDLVNFSSERELADLIYQLGEERRSRRIARAIVRARKIQSTGHLARVIESCVPRTGRLHPATQTFMALRIAVNEELGELDRLLETAPELVASGGRIVIITFHSTEDRKVKRAFQELSRRGQATILTKHVITPTEAEIENNAASRSAKLRAVEMK